MLALLNSAQVQDRLGPLTVPVLIQYLSLRDHTDGMALEANGPDQLLWTQSPLREYSSSSTYLAKFIGQSAVFGVKELWKVKALIEHRFLVWHAI
jgi:hypothetical protein